jgi:hypothetical protein
MNDSCLIAADSERRESPVERGRLKRSLNPGLTGIPDFHFSEDNGA